MQQTLDDAYRAHRVALVRLAVHLVDDVGSAEDVVHDVFVRLHRRDSGEVPTYAYLRTAVLNQARSALRRRRLVRLGVRSTPRLEYVDDPGVGITERDQVRAALDRLSARQKEVVVLRYYEDMSVNDIASALGSTPNATSAALGRALKAVAAYVGSDR